MDSFFLPVKPFLMGSHTWRNQQSTAHSMALKAGAMDSLFCQVIPQSILPSRPSLMMRWLTWWNRQSTAHRLALKVRVMDSLFCQVSPS
jgi:hypothetical protein